MKYFLITFGCQINKSDSERISAVFEKIGHHAASKENEADLIVVNMCSVRQSAVDRVYGLANKFAKLKIKNPKLKTILTGCISEKDLHKFKNLFDYIFTIKTLPKWPEFLRKEKFFFYSNPRNQNFVKEYGIEYLKEKAKYSNNFSVFIPISTGCDNFCSFCIVPYVRGPLISRSYEEILRETEEAIKNGAKEIWLLGQNVNDYKNNVQSPTRNLKIINFAKLLEMINDIPGNFWIRFTSPHPKNFSEELIKKIAKCQKFAPYLNLPVQSGDDEILKRMNRSYTVKQYKNLIKKIRAAFKKFRKGLEKEIAISTDVIVGFPGETKEQFQNTVKLFKQVKFDMAYIAQFSPRPGTLAEKMGDNIPQKEKERRWKTLHKILEKTALLKNKKFIGKEIEVLPEEEKNGFLIGKSRHYKTIKFEGEKDLIGKFVKVKIKKADPFGLLGEIQ